jgi:hypothetical protein
MPSASLTDEVTMSRAKVSIEEYGAYAVRKPMRLRIKGSAAAIIAKDPPTQVPSNPLREGSIMDCSISQS